MQKDDNCQGCNSNTYVPGKICCVTLDRLSNYLPLSGNLSITFESKQSFILRSRILFVNLTRLDIRAASSESAVIRCLDTPPGVGIKFDKILDVQIVNLKFENCGAKHQTYRKRNVSFSSTLFFLKCENVSLQSVSVSHSHGFGVVMYNVIGYSVIYKSIFHNNSAAKESSTVGGGGLYIGFTPYDRKVKKNVSILISNCIFTLNYAKVYSRKFENSMFRFGQGGGIFIRLLGTSSVNFIKITHCSLINNTAEWGGALHLMLSNNYQKTVVYVSDTVMIDNKALTGGGGMILYVRNHKTAIINVTFKHCKFIHNSAGKYGGGSAIEYNLKTFSKSIDIQFSSSKWYNNTARLYGSAVDISTTLNKSEISKTVTRFLWCTFNKNWILSIRAKNNTFREGKAAFMISFSSVSFRGLIGFTNNNGSALYALSSKVQFTLGSQVIFKNNIGRNGGAIVLISSYLHVQKHTYLSFIRNKAYLKGGAIYSISLGELGPHKIKPHDCFFQSDEKLEQRNITISFTKNNAAYSKGKYNGNTIYTTSLLSCIPRKSRSIRNITLVLNKLANFTFIRSHAYAQVTTSEATLSVKTKLATVNVIPGKEIQLNISTRDEFGHMVPSKYRVFIRQKECPNFKISVDDRYKSLPNNQVKLYGMPEASCILTIEMEGNKQTYTVQYVTLIECPPGFLLNNETKFQNQKKDSKPQCSCASGSTEEYQGIYKCDGKKFKARIKQGMWAGYDSPNASEWNLRVAYCPHNFCSYSSSSTKNYISHLLPSVANQTVLDEFICRKGRTGRLCGSCKPGYSVHFHSPEYKCKKSDLCSVGWLFYILSELMPLTLMFIIILRFNVSFTSGALTGFLFYAQIIDFLNFSGTTLGETFPNWALLVIKGADFAYGFFNLNFFSLDSLSFCLWDGASTLDIITFKFMTIAYTFLLVLTVFLIMNICTLKCRQNWIRIPFKQSLIHGMSAFLVTCLVQTIKVTFSIFSSATVYQKGGVISSYQAFYEGSLAYFRGKHLLYAIPALFIAITIVFIPTLLLLWYPLGPKILNKCGLSETKIVELLEKVLLINRLKPLIDSFQGCYKDNFRSFAGLLFLYRIAILASVAFSFGYTQSHVLVQVQLLVMFLAHALAQPYKETTHNLIDSLLLSNLALVNIFEIYIHSVRVSSNYRLSTHIATALQAFLTVIPLLYFLVFVCKTLLQMIVRQRNCCRRKQDDEGDIPFRLLNESVESDFEDHSIMQD